jgi:hypothetical protein
MSLRAELEVWPPRARERQAARLERFVHVHQLTIGDRPTDVTFSARADREGMQSACDLINERYGWRGYGSSHSLPSDAHHTTFTAEVDDRVVGTITLGLDSARGLTIDRTFAEETHRARTAKGSKICELTKLAFDPRVRSHPVLAKLFHMAFIYGTAVSDYTDLFIEVNPRHVLFYETMLGFERIGSLVTNASVAAPAQLMRLKIDHIRRSIAELAGRGAAAAHRSLYRFFFAPAQEAEIRRALASAGHQADASRRTGLAQHGRSVFGSDMRAALPEGSPPPAAAPPPLVGDAGRRGTDGVRRAA